jgi:ABC-type uncharacterized transport system ATPase subunit
VKKLIEVSCTLKTKVIFYAISHFIILFLSQSQFQLLFVFSKKVAGYVPQEDILMGSQTVREALNFYAELKLPKTMKQKEKHAIVLISLF